MGLVSPSTHAAHRQQKSLTANSQELTANQALIKLITRLVLVFTQSIQLSNIVRRSSERPALAVEHYICSKFSPHHHEDSTLSSREKTGGADRDRTGDLMLAKHALSQLSYSP